jgi:nucleotide-binding universal stress UspA family protein
MTSGADQRFDGGVVVGIDGSDTALGGAQWAAQYAARHTLPLTLLHVIPRFELHFTGTDDHDLPAGSDGDALLAAAADAIRAAHPDLVIHTEAVRGSVAPTLTDAAVDARMLVVGKGASEHRALGGHAVKVVHRAPCPVLIWRPPVATRTGKPLPVVVGVDESEASRRAVEEAFDIARVLHARLTVAHMWDITAAVGMGDLGGQGNMDWPLLETLQNKQRLRMDELVRPLADKYPNAHVNKVFQDVTPAKGLIDLSREDQLVVVGSHGRGRLADALLGSVSQNLIHHAECPVLVVREETSS